MSVRGKNAPQLGVVFLRMYWELLPLAGCSVQAVEGADIVLGALANGDPLSLTTTYIGAGSLLHLREYGFKILGEVDQDRGSRCSELWIRSKAPAGKLLC